MFSKKSSHDNNSILVVNTEKLGDIVLSADFLSTLRNKNEYDSYSLILDEKYLGLLDPVKLNYTIIPINKNKYRYNPFYRISFILQIRNKAFRTVLNIAPERGMVNDEIVLTSGAGRKIALKESSLYLNRKTLLRNNQKYTSIFISSEISEYKRLYSYLGSKEISSDIILVKEVPDYLIKEEYIVIAPMASEMERTWGLNNYRRLIENLKQKIVLLGSKSEKDSLNELRGEKENILILAGEVDLNQAAGIIRKAQVYIGNDSGLTHIAHYYGVPLIAIIGGGKYNMFFPYKERGNAIFLFKEMDCFGCSWFCIHERMKCFDISVETVLRATESLYENR